MIGLAYIVLSDKWEEHKLKRAAAAKTDSDYSTSEVPDTDIEGVVINYCYRPVFYIERRYALTAFDSRHRRDKIKD